jgi:hypothetical protein
MTKAVIARGANGICFQPEPPPDSDIVISASVGEGGVNKADDVRLIQSVLNNVPAADGGPDPDLDVDGICGQLTTKAISDFQRRKLGFVDARVDPNGPTLRALNGQRRRTVTAVKKGARRGPARAPANGPPPLQPNPFIVPVIESLVPPVRVAIRAASFQLAVVQPFVTTHRQKLPTGRFLENVRFCLKLLDSTFSFFKFDNPLLAHHRLSTTFRNMEVALSRSFDTPPLIAKKLFVPNSFSQHMDDTALAYAALGGAFDGPDVLTTEGGPANQIVLCRDLAIESRTTQITTVIHELAHYVGPEKDPNDDHSDGDFLTPADRPRMDALAPRLKIRNAEHYAGYAFLCGFRLLQEFLKRSK